MRDLFLTCVLLISAVSATSSIDESSDLDRVVDFLWTNRPPFDNVTREFVTNNAKLALDARAQHSWTRDVPFDIFLNYVSPYANVNERRDDWRPLFVQKFSPFISSASSLSEAALTINRRIWSVWNITFLSDQTPTIMSPFQTIAAHHASCTGLSIFLVDALRSVGIPARVTGTEVWNNGKGGNHNWVEVYTGDDVWSFTGAAEWTYLGWNHTWFFPNPAKDQVPGSEKHGIFSVEWDRSNLDGVFYPMAWDLDNREVPGVDVTESYLKASA